MSNPKQSTHVAWRSMGEFTVIIELGTHRLFHELNEVGSFIWSLCDGTRDPAQIAETVVREYDVAASEAGREVADFLSLLAGQKLITWKS